MKGRVDDDELLDRILQTAIVASKKAGEIILGNAGGAEVASRKANSRDLLTLIDPLCEQAIRDAVLAEFPAHDFLGEEDVDPGKEASAEALNSKLEKREATDGQEDQDRWLWIVDPIDGTTNFVRIDSCLDDANTSIAGIPMLIFIALPASRFTGCPCACHPWRPRATASSWWGSFTIATATSYSRPPEVAGLF
jgi:Inositol monophosphatase family